MNKGATNKQNQHASSTAPPSAELGGLVWDNFDLLTDFFFLICSEILSLHSDVLTLIVVSWRPPGLTPFDLFSSLDSLPSIKADSTELLLHYCDPAGQTFSFRRDQKCFLKNKKEKSNLIQVYIFKLITYFTAADKKHCCLKASSASAVFNLIPLSVSVTIHMHPA